MFPAKRQLSKGSVLALAEEWVCLFIVTLYSSGLGSRCYGLGYWLFGARLRV